MKPTKLGLLAAVAICSAACSTNSVQEQFIPDFSQYPLCSDARDSSVIFVNIKNGEKESKTYLGAYPFYNDLAIVRTADGWFYINRHFKAPINEYFLDATHFSEGIAYTVKPEGHITAINEDGEILYLLQNAESVYTLSEGRAVYKGKNGLYGLLDSNGDVVKEAKFDGAEKAMKDGTLAVMQKEGAKSYWGIVDRDGETLIPAKYTKITRRNGGFTIYREDGKAAWYDLASNKVSDFEYKDIVKDGKLYCFKTRKGKHGWMTKKHKEVIEPVFDQVTLFDGKDVAFAQDSKKGREWGIIDTKGEWVIKPRYASVTTTDYLPIIRNEKGEYGVIDYEGKVLIKTNKMKIEHIADEYYLVTNSEDEIGIMKADGEEEWIARPAYERFKGIIYRPSTMVNTDFVDIPAICNTVRKDAEKLQKTTVNGLMTTYNLAKGDLPRRSANIKLSEYQHRNYTIKTEAEKVSAWSVTYDWWDGEKVFFNSKATVKRYAITITLKNRYANYKEQIVSRIKQDLGLDSASSAKINGKTYRLVDTGSKQRNTIKVSITVE